MHISIDETNKGPLRIVATGELACFCSKIQFVYKIR